MEEEMEELCVEGLATHGDPESCVDDPRGRGEALTGDRTGQPLRRERLFRGADAVETAEGNMAGGVIASRSTTPRGLRPWHARTLLVREPGDLVADHRPVRRLVRIGKALSRSR